ncbi:hypothetical protein [Flavobacterium aquatile]|uniref:Uncharacterized protein n=1 Tax=Flavobacterium aquatile LMG 4008 = ATCC 11947 TaxID=1453498 RepID=A0A095U3H0_9FLAO|nr:hypothetical protein [Flavobacterium aquatile]KGD69108.1 hypothetical protein LG45_05610 [Flavobacterium aquatile LMG 4008 = ATCC 11947]OXA65819.1 hypothetical protein B0A61_14355 [Flavobacterium aquatile LMG 4008 = ATCC 11947]GEC78035.1 hypothetical protein FAQ01_09050 [Flavobacterium aquatile]
MKKRLEAELISIAHRVLKLKNKSEVDQLYLETQKLYETLAILKFYGDNYDQVKATVAKEDLEEKLVASLETKTPEVEEENLKQVQMDKVVEPIVAEEKEEIVAEVEQVEEQEIVAAEEESEVQEEAVADEPVAEEVEEPVIVGEITVDEEDEIEDEVPVIEAKDDLDFEPIFELASEEEGEVEEPRAEEPKAKQNQISFEDLLGHNYSEPVFVKPNDVTASVPKKEIVEEKAEVVVDEKVSILNEKLAQGINIGLNDRVGFVKYLFNGSSEDFNRVLSQLNTFDTYSDAKNFINEMVKPDYNNWKGQDDFEERFMELVERKFK